MNKKLLILATAAAFSTSAALADIKVYGTAHVDMRVNAPDSYGSVNSNNSTLGIKVTADFAGLKALFKHEFSVSALDSATFFDEAKKSYLSLFTDAGMFWVGRNDTPATKALKFVGNHHLDDSIADFSQVGFTEYVVSNALVYESNSYSGFSLAAATVLGETTGTDNSSLFDSFSLGLMYDEGHGVKLGFGYESLADTGAGQDDAKILQLGGSYTFDNIMIGAQFEKTENMIQEDRNAAGYGNPQQGIDRTAFGVTGKVTFGSNALSINLGREEIETDQAARKSNFASIALHHTISDQVSTYIAWSNKNAGTPDFKTAAQNNNLDSAVTSLIKQRAVAIGMIYDF